MHEDEQRTFNDLQLPTMSLIEKFCQTPPEVKAYFVGILAVYENNPTQDTINKINEVVKAQTSRDDKTQWLKSELKTIPSSVIDLVQRNYIEPNAPALIGLPCSGELMTFLDYVPKNVKDRLMEAQAAARILYHIDNGKSDLKSTLIHKDKNGEIKEQKDYLNKPFATTIQRVEQLTEFLSSYKANEADMLLVKKHDDMLENYIGKDEAVSIPQVDIVLAECKKLALVTLVKTANTISVSYPQAAERISSLASVYGSDKNESPTNIKLIAKVAKDAAQMSTAYYEAEFVATDKGITSCFNEEEATLFKNIIKKRVQQLQPQTVNSKILTPTR